MMRLQSIYRHEVHTLCNVWLDTPFVSDYALHKVHMHCLDVWLYKIMHCLACKTSEHIEIPRKLLPGIFTRETKFMVMNHELVRLVRLHRIEYRIEFICTSVFVISPLQALVIFL